MAKQLLGIKPFSFQRDVINEVINSKGTGKTVVVKSRRQVGKSVLLANLLLYFAINYEKTTNYCVSPTLKQGKKIYKSIVSAISGAKILKSKNATELSLTFVNESTIQFKSAEQRESLRGESCNGLCAIDEAAYIPDEIFEIVRPWTDYHKAVTLMVSTPFVKNGFYFRWFNYGLNGQYNTVSIDWTSSEYEDDLNVILPPERLEEYKQVLPANVFRTEYLGLFLDGDGTVYTNIHANLKRTEIGRNDRLFVGLDWATGKDGDYTVISAFNQNGEQVLLKYFNNKSTVAQIDLIVKELEPYAKQIEVISSETNSLGTPMTDMFKTKSQILAQKVREFNTSNSSKNALVVMMQVALEQNEIKLLPDDKQVQEFSYYSAEYNPTTRNVTYNAPQGLHDDCVMATMIAYNGLKEYAKTGVYCIGGVGKKKARDKFERFR